MTFGDDILAGKAAFIAGGTRGMNLAIAERYASAGADVAVLSRDPERCAAAAEKLASYGVKSLGIPCDVRDYEGLADAFKQAADAFGGLDIVVAGQAGNFYAPALGMSANGFRTIVEIDLIGTFSVFKASYEHLRRPGASLIAITAPEAVRPLHFQAHVCAAKAGVNMVVKVLALEWGPAGVRVNGISPGPIEGSWGMANVASPTEDIVEKIRKAMPLKRWGKESDIADAGIFLASDASSYVTGTILDVDGGAVIASPEGAEVDAVFDPSKDVRVKRKS